MLDETEIKPEKQIWRKWWFWAIFGFVFIITIVIATSGGMSHNVGNNNVRKYTLINAKDISYGNVVRMTYQIVVPSDITVGELKSTLAQVIKKKSTENPNIDEISVYAWESEEGLKEGNLPLGHAEWCPNGNWGSITPEIARSNIRNNYKIVYDVDEKALDYRK